MYVYICDTFRLSLSPKNTPTWIKLTGKVSVGLINDDKTILGTQHADLEV